MKSKLILVAGLLATSAFAQVDLSTITDYATKNPDKITAAGKAAMAAKQNGGSNIEAALAAKDAAIQPAQPADPVTSMKDKAKAAAFGALLGN